MTDRTITALYATRADADAAVQQLKSAGFGHGVDVHDQGGASGSTSSASSTFGSSSPTSGNTTLNTQAQGDEGGFMTRLKGFFGNHEDTHAYGEGLRRGHFLLTAKVDDQDADEVARILEGTNAVDFDETQAGWRQQGWTGAAATTGAGFGAAKATTAAAGEEVIPVYEEELRVGKREVERGGVRVRSYVVETPVSEQIGLREETVSIERRPVDRVVTGAQANFTDRTIEMTETAEEAVVAKDTILRDEVVVRKDASERVETIQDKVRRTEVEVEDTTVRGTPGTTSTPRGY